jgi:hypothetical protein
MTVVALPFFGARQRPQRRVQPAIYRFQEAVLVLWIGSATLRLLTYQPWVDGDWRVYYASVGFWMLAAPVVWLIVRVLSDSRSVLPWLAAIGVLLPGDMVHYMRMWQATTWTPEQSVVVNLADGNARNTSSTIGWKPTAHPGASISLENGQLLISSPRGVVGFIELRLPFVPKPQDGRYWLPLGTYTAHYDEAVEWKAQVDRDAPYYVILETKDLLIQATSYGLMVLYPDLDGKKASFDVNLPRAGDGRPHVYRLERTDGLIRLRLDGHGVWVRPDAGAFVFVRFGENRSVPEHGGKLWLDSIRYIRNYIN